MMRTMCLRKAVPSTSMVTSAALAADLHPAQQPAGGLALAVRRRGRRRSRARPPAARPPRAWPPGPAAPGSASCAGGAAASAPGGSRPGSGSACPAPPAGRRTRRAPRCTSSTATSGGRLAFRPRRKPPVGMRGVDVRKFATCPTACTPASVRPAPRTNTVLAGHRLHRRLQVSPAPCAGPAAAASRGSRCRRTRSAGAGCAPGARAVVASRVRTRTSGRPARCCRRRGACSSGPGPTPRTSRTRRTRGCG